MSEFLSPNQASEKYKLHHDESDTPSELEIALAKEGVAAIEMPLSAEDFTRFSNGFAVCIEECPALLGSTNYLVDDRYGSNVGYTRKNKKVDPVSGVQVEDPKNYFHFSEAAHSRWGEQFQRAPKIIRDFLADGYDIHHTLLGVAKQQVAELEGSYPNMSRLYFPDDESFSFLRLLRYDGYEPSDHMAQVATPHYDIAGLTIQAYADAKGFWASKGGHKGEKKYYDTEEHEAYMFAGRGHEKIYGHDDKIKALWHGVDRIIPAGLAWVPERTAVILFVDAPEVDYRIRSNDTRPYITTQMAERALVGANA